MNNEERKAYRELEESFEEPDLERELSEKDYWDDAIDKFEEELERRENFETYIKGIW